MWRAGSLLTAAAAALGRSGPSGDFSEVQRVLERLADPFGLTDTDAAGSAAFASTSAAAAEASEVRRGRVPWRALG